MKNHHQHASELQDIYQISMKEESSYYHEPGNNRDHCQTCSSGVCWPRWDAAARSGRFKVWGWTQKNSMPKQAAVSLMPWAHYSQFLTEKPEGQNCTSCAMCRPRKVQTYTHSSRRAQEHNPCPAATSKFSPRAQRLHPVTLPAAQTPMC